MIFVAIRYLLLPIVLDFVTPAHADGQRLGIDDVHGEVKPSDKLILVLLLIAALAMSLYESLFRLGDRQCAAVTCVVRRARQIIYLRRR